MYLSSSTGKSSFQGVYLLFLLHKDSQLCISRTDISFVRLQEAINNELWQIHVVKKFLGQFRSACILFVLLLVFLPLLLLFPLLGLGLLLLLFSSRWRGIG